MTDQEFIALLSSGAKELTDEDFARLFPGDTILHRREVAEFVWHVCRLNRAGNYHADYWREYDDNGTRQLRMVLAFGQIREKL